MMSRNTTLVPSIGLRIGPACEAGLSAGMRRERVPPQRRKKEKRVISMTYAQLTCNLLAMDKFLVFIYNKKCER